MSPTITSAESIDAGALIAVRVGILRFELLRDRLHLGARGLDRRAILRAGRRRQVVAAAALIAAARRPQRRPELRRAAGAN